MNAREKVFRPHWEFRFAEDPVATCRFRAAEGDGILSFIQDKRALSIAMWQSPRSGRSGMAQRFIAGILAPFGMLVREADGRPLNELPLNRIFLPPVSRAGNRITCIDPSTEGAGLFPIVRCADFFHRASLKSIVLLIAILAITFLGSCAANNREASSTIDTREVVDEAGRHVRLQLRIDRIVSLAPNLTEIVYAIGAGDRLVGDTSFCDYPPAAKSITKVGDTMQPSIERIIALKPQIVLVSTASQLESFTRQLDQQQIAVYVTNPNNLERVFQSIATLGQLFGTSEAATRLASALRQRAQAVEAATAQLKRVRVFYQVSGEPLYTIGRDAYLTDLVRRAGGISVTADVPGAFPRFSAEAALATKPDAIILPTGGAMGSANSSVAPALENSPAVLNNHVYKINDDLLSRPGPRLIDGLEQMARALHPEAFK